MRNLSKLKDPNRYYNWYHGYTGLQYPYYDYKVNQLKYFVNTTYTSGNMTTQYFGEKFNATKVDENIAVQILVFVPLSVYYDINTTLITLLFNLEKNTMKEVSDNDKIGIKTVGYIDADKTHVIKNITGPFDYKYDGILLNRKVTYEEIRNIKKDKMPGFRFSWKYNKEVELWRKYSYWNIQFTR